MLIFIKKLFLQKYFYGRREKDKTKIPVLPSVTHLKITYLFTTPHIEIFCVGRHQREGDRRLR